MRTEAQIQAELEARLAEIEAEAERLRVEAEKPVNKYPCETCKWVENAGDVFFEKCANPLVKGYGAAPYTKRLCKPNPPPLCGPEKALWQEKEWRWDSLMPDWDWWPVLAFLGPPVIIIGLPLLFFWLMP